MIDPTLGVYKQERLVLTIRNNEELEGVVRVGRVVSSALDTMKNAVKPRITTKALDDLCAEVFERHGARSGPQLVYGFPGVSCISINDEAVHGIPRETRTIREGDLVKLDVTAELNGYFADAAITVEVGKVSSRRRRLTRCTRSALYHTLKGTRASRPLNGIGRSIQTAVERQGFNVMPELGGHGVGRSVHEEPFVPNYYDPWDNRQLHPGLVLAIEPVISDGSGEAIIDDDGWTIKTADGSSSAHFEHTVVITQRGPLIVTA